MAYAEPRYDKNGKLSHFRLVVSAGIDKTGKQVKRCRNWIPPDFNISDRKLKQQAFIAAYEFEQKLQQGFNFDKSQKFAIYAQYVLELKKRNGLAPTTYERYQVMLMRINPAIGHMKLEEIRPWHLNNLYKELAEPTTNPNSQRSIAKKKLSAELLTLGITKHEIVEECNISATTLNAAISGKPIQRKTAVKLCEYLGCDYSDLFSSSNASLSQLSPKTILGYHRLISTIMAQAEKELLISFNPAAKASPPKVKNKTADYFQPDEMKQIILALEDAPLKWKAVTYLLIDTGCRRGEVMGLQWKHVNFEKGTLMIEQALLYTPGKGIYLAPPKNGQPRAVCLSPDSLSILQKWHREQMALRMKNRLIWNDTDFVFTRDDGNPLNPNSITAWLGKFSEEKCLPHIHPHAFRHTVASTLIANGVDIITTAAELGHADATTTMNIYAHQIAKSRSDAANVRAGVFATIRKAQ